MGTAATVKAILINSGVKLTGEFDLGNNGTWITLDAIPSIFQGFGAVRLNQALVFNPPLAGGTANLYVDQDSQLGTGEVKNYCLDGVRATSRRRWCGRTRRAARRPRSPWSTT